MFFTSKCGDGEYSQPGGLFQNYHGAGYGIFCPGQRAEQSVAESGGDGSSRDSRNTG